MKTKLLSLFALLALPLTMFAPIKDNIFTTNAPVGIQAGTNVTSLSTNLGQITINVSGGGGSGSSANATNVLFVAADGVNWPTNVIVNTLGSNYTLMSAVSNAAVNGKTNLIYIFGGTHFATNIGRNGLRIFATPGTLLTNANSGNSNNCIITDTGGALTNFGLYGAANLGVVFGGIFLTNPLSSITVEANDLFLTSGTTTSTNWFVNQSGGNRLDLTIHNATVIPGAGTNIAALYVQEGGNGKFRYNNIYATNTNGTAFLFRGMDPAIAGNFNTEGSEIHATRTYFWKSANMALQRTWHKYDQIFSYLGGSAVNQDSNTINAGLNYWMDFGKLNQLAANIPGATNPVLDVRAGIARNYFKFFKVNTTNMVFNFINGAWNDLEVTEADTTGSTNFIGRCTSTESNYISINVYHVGATGRGIISDPDPVVGAYMNLYESRITVDDNENAAAIEVKGQAKPFFRNVKLTTGPSTNTIISLDEPDIANDIYLDGALRINTPFGRDIAPAGALFYSLVKSDGTSTNYYPATFIATGNSAAANKAVFRDDLLGSAVTEGTYSLVTVTSNGLVSAGAQLSPIAFATNATAFNALFTNKLGAWITVHSFFTLNAALATDTARVTAFVDQTGSGSFEWYGTASRGPGVAMASDDGLVLDMLTNAVAYLTNLSAGGASATMITNKITIHRQ